MSEQQPILPAEAWYTSPVQIAGVVAGASQVASIVIRWFGLPITVEEIDAYAADALQVITVLGVLYAMFKRGRSSVAPLTFTANQASIKNAANPPLLDVDPTKPKETHP